MSRYITYPTKTKLSATKKKWTTLIDIIRGLLI